MLKWLLLDLNSFFASCEQQEDPSLRGKPVAVVPMITDSTCVIAASYEAKKFGVKTNVKVGDAKKMCPGLILKSGNHKLYTHYHHKIVKAVQEVLPIKKVLSIDEVSCELLGKEREPENARKIAQQMKDHIRNVVGSEIKSSVGIGPNILVAKIASDMQKPDGLVMVSADEILQKIGPLPIQDMPGVGRNMKYKLNGKNYFIIADFINAPEQQLRKHWGSIWGLRIARQLRGEDVSFHEREHQHSISHQHVLPPNLRDIEKSLQVTIKLLLKAAARLRAEKIKCKRLGVYLKFQNGQRFEKSIGFTETDDSYFLVDILKKTWPKRSSSKPVKAAIVLADLIHGPNQLSFFDNPKKESINQALDVINSRFGHNTLILASTKGVINSGKTRIAFNHIPELSDEFDEE